MAEIEQFIERWRKSGAAERSNFQSFVKELCAVLELPEPNPAKPNEAENDYIFERNVRFQHDDGTHSNGRIDLYRRGAFVMEGKQSRMRAEDDRSRDLVQLGLALEEASFRRTGSGAREGRGWDTFMAAAKQQAEAYAKALPKEHGWPPFIVVVDVGNVIEVYADFSLQGKHYAQFPDRQGYRITLDQLRSEHIQQRLRAIWRDPLSLDPSRRTAQVTREIAALLAQLSRSLEQRGNSPGRVASFLMRCLFTMFAEDVGLLKPRSFQELLEGNQGKAGQVHHALSYLWREMNDGGYSPTLRDTVLRFNGGLFRDATAIELDEQDLDWLILAAKRDWTNVEPAIFGTLLERALDERERHKLGAHYTPRAYVERLVVPTIIEPLTDDWRTVQAEAADLLKKGENDRALDAVKAFHRKLCTTRVLDPACGTGNFLYVSMELMKRLEGEVLELLADLGDDQYILELDRHTVDPHQFLGLELNPRAVPIAELVLWIGYLQWHFRTRGRVMPAEPVLRAFANIREQDAVLNCDKQEVLRDEKGHPLTRWDGVTKKLHPITGEEVPDPDATVPLYIYVNPRPAEWPDVNFVVGNPPFLGKGAIMRQELGDDYVIALRDAYPELPAGIDYVAYWWNQAANCAREGNLVRFGLVATNSLSQSMNRRVLQRHLSAKKPVSLAFVIPDHPWVDSADGAAVRICMTVGRVGRLDGALLLVASEDEDGDAFDVELNEKRGYIHADFSIGVDALSTVALQSNVNLSCNGVMLASAGFLLSHTQRAVLKQKASTEEMRLVRPFLHGSDLTERVEGEFIIDTFGMTEAELHKYPYLCQLLLERVKPNRDSNRDKSFRQKWWLFGRNRPELRRGIASLRRYIATTETAKHRFFQFISAEAIPDHMLVCIADDDASVLGILSSHIHVTWALAAGGTLEDRPRYNKTLCFDPFPFPAVTDEQKDRIRALGERLDAFRKNRLAEHKTLTMTKLYNVLEKLRGGEALNEKEKAIHELGLVSVLKQVHDELDDAVADAYGWPRDLTDEQILERLVGLNKERAAEERGGLVRWLRPEFQAPKEAVKKPQQVEAELVAAEEVVGKPLFPREPAEQVAKVRAMLAAEGKPIKASELAHRFRQGKRVEPRVRDLLEIMAAIGQAQTENGSRYFAVK